MPSTQSRSQGAATQLPESVDVAGLRRRESRYWYVLAGMCILTTVGLAFAISPVLRESMAESWPSANSHILFLSALSALLILFVTYLTLQKHKTRDLRQSVERMAQDALRRERQNSARLRALLNVSRMMGSVTDAENVFETITKTCLEVFDCHQASLMLLDETTHYLDVRAATGHKNPEQVKATKVRVGEGIAGWVAQRRQPVVLNRDTDLSRYPELKLKDRSIASAMVVPIVLRDELVGVLNISSRSPNTSYGEEDLQALRVFAENAGTCIRHTEHVEWMRRTIHDTLENAPRQRPAGRKNDEALTRE